MTEERDDKATQDQGVFKVIHLLDKMGSLFSLPVQIRLGILAIPYVPFIESQPQLFLAPLPAAHHIANGGYFFDLPVHGEVQG